LLALAEQFGIEEYGFDEVGKRPSARPSPAPPHHMGAGPLIDRHMALGPTAQIKQLTLQLLSEKVILYNYQGINAPVDVGSPKFLRFFKHASQLLGPSNCWCFRLSSPASDSAPVISEEI